MLGRSSFVPGPGGSLPLEQLALRHRALAVVGDSCASAAWQPLHVPLAAPPGQANHVSVPQEFSRGRIDPGLMAAQLMHGFLPDTKHLVL